MLAVGLAREGEVVAPGVGEGSAGVVLAVVGRRRLVADFVGEHEAAAAEPAPVAAGEGLAWVPDGPPRGRRL